LYSFLTDLAKGHTPVLLGSRSGEDWLAKGTFDDNIYELPGLDLEAASTLADRVLERNNARQYRQDEDLRKLIKVLDGFPLALEVVLANLTHQTPTEVLAALQAGDVSIDPNSDSHDKSESILRCIDYSHSNLSPEAQQLLLCLAPFTSVIDTDALDNYTSHLRQQPVLANLQFERWQEVLQEAANWGLLSPDPDIPRFLRLQPIFPYFLRSRLNTKEQAEARVAVEIAFRHHYNQLGNSLYNLLTSKKPQEQQAGQLLIGLEYENLVTALNLALSEQVSIQSIYFPLSRSLDLQQDHPRGLELGHAVLSRMEKYRSDKLSGSLGIEFVCVIDGIARRQLNLKQYEKAEASYQKVLSLLFNNQQLDADTIKKQSTNIYHQLGIMLGEQRQWEQAEQYFQQALQIYIEHNGGYEQAKTYHQLGMMVQEQRQWKEASKYFLQSLEIDATYNDSYNMSIDLRSLARLWKASEDANLPAVVATILGYSVEETEKLLHDMLEEG